MIPAWARAIIERNAVLLLADALPSGCYSKRGAVASAVTLLRQERTAAEELEKAARASLNGCRWPDHAACSSRHCRRSCEMASDERRFIVEAMEEQREIGPLLAAGEAVLRALDAKCPPI